MFNFFKIWKIITAFMCKKTKNPVDRGCCPPGRLYRMFIVGPK